MYWRFKSNSILFSHFWEYTSVDLSSFIEDNRQLVDIRLYGDYKMLYVDAFIITTSPPFPAPKVADAGVLSHLSRSMTKPTNDPYAKQRLGLACVSTQSDQSLRCSLSV